MWNDEKYYYVCFYVDMKLCPSHKERTQAKVVREYGAEEGV
jgi:hypothetical protein